MNKGDKMSTKKSESNVQEIANKNYKEMKLSNHAVGSLMMCLQKCLIEQSDITDILKNLTFIEKDSVLFCKNAPLVKFSFDNTPNEGDE